MSRHFVFVISCDMIGEKWSPNSWCNVGFKVLVVLSIFFVWLLLFLALNTEHRCTLDQFKVENTVYFTHKLNMKIILNEIRKHIRNFKGFNLILSYLFSIYLSGSDLI